MIAGAKYKYPPENWLSWKLATVRFLKPDSSGKGPVKEFSISSRVWRAVRDPNDGNGPVSLLWLRSRRVRVLREL